MKKSKEVYLRENHLLGEFLKEQKIIKKFYANIREFINYSDEFWDDTRKCNKVEQWIVVAFAWRHTKEGYGFWQDINNRFLKHLKSQTKHGRQETTKG